MQRQPINIIRDNKRKRCATCRHARLISYGLYEPLLAECTLQPNPYDRGGHPFAIMVANLQRCKQHDFRHSPANKEKRQKK